MEVMSGGADMLAIMNVTIRNDRAPRERTIGICFPLEAMSSQFPKHEFMSASMGQSRHKRMPNSRYCAAGGHGAIPILAIIDSLPSTLGDKFFQLSSVADTDMQTYSSSSARAAAEPMSVASSPY